MEESQQHGDTEEGATEDARQTRVGERITEDALLRGAADAEGESGRESREHARRSQEEEGAAVTPAEALGADGKGKDDEAC